MTPTEEAQRIVKQYYEKNLEIMIWDANEFAKIDVQNTIDALEELEGYHIDNNHSVIYIVDLINDYKQVLKEIDKL
jgi:hypothetical protein